MRTLKRTQSQVFGDRPLTRLQRRNDPSLTLTPPLEAPSRKRQATVGPTGEPHPAAVTNPRTQDSFSGAPTSQVRHTSPSTELDRANADAQRLLQKSPLYRQLEQEAGPIKFVTAPESQQQKGMFYPKSTGNEIGLHANLNPHERASIMAFEMTNAANRTRVKDTQTKALFQHYGDVMRGNRPDATVNHARREQYAKNMEQIEFDGTKRHYDMMQDGIKNHGWDPSMLRFKNFHEGPNAGFDRYWEVQNRSKDGGPSHSDFHRGNYDKTIAIAEKMANDNKLKLPQSQAGASSSTGTAAS
ncbi:hypothetical protein F0U60_24510 [Archangium minus]|uniref:Uncharacterized protein n=1 Tax=Archangium minus TaxID=83450 RepID=A0ABY9WT16_9BACT|nr:hypothetical protein F0U60_24510 [Archangium minus]